MEGEGEGGWGFVFQIGGSFLYGREVPHGGASILMGERVSKKIVGSGVPPRPPPPHYGKPSAYVI